mmetsp:Transcript_22645/g.34042  ORF Transcript_22645/g.34042 Transcript_22645/m.34042 type:complete len:88 (+) Transcript_22645:63-326(+)
MFQIVFFIILLRVCWHDKGHKKAPMRLISMHHAGFEHKKQQNEEYDKKGETVLDAIVSTPNKYKSLITWHFNIFPRNCCNSSLKNGH